MREGTFKTTVSMEVTVTYIALCLLTITTGQGVTQYEDAKRLSETILSPSNYSRSIVPLHNLSDTMVVDVSLSLIAIAGLNDITQELVTNVFMFFLWRDEKLTWNPADYGGISTLDPESAQTWKPKVILVNTLEKQAPFDNENSRLTLVSHGMIFWSPGALLSTHCSLNMKTYPFDVQHCKIQFCSMGYTNDTLRFGFLPNKVDQAFYYPNPGWDFLSSYSEIVNVTIYGNLAYSCPTFTLIVKRRPISILLTVILPVVLLSLLNNMVFLIPEESGEKISYAITVLLSIGVFMSIVSTMTPQASDVVPALTIYLFTLLLSFVFTAAATIVIVALHNHNQKQEDRLYGHSNCMATILSICKKNRSINPEKPSLEAPSLPTFKQNNFFEEENGYKTISKYLNILCFVSFSLLWFAATFWYFTFTNS